MLNFVRTFLIMRAQGVRFIIAIEEVRNYGKVVYIKSIFENGWWEDDYPSSYLSGLSPGHKLQKPSEESDVFQSLGTISIVLFTKKQSQKGRDMTQCFHGKYRYSEQQKKGTGYTSQFSTASISEEKKVFIVRDEAPHFLRVLTFNPA